MTRRINALPSIPARYLALLAMSVFIASAHGQTVHINSPANGTEVAVASAFYRPAQEAVEVQVGVTLPSGTPLGRYKVRINGVPAVWQPANGFLAWIGPSSPPWWAAAGWPAWCPYVAEYTDPFNPQIPILAELIDTTTGQVVSRDRVVLIDARDDDDLVGARTGRINESVAVQITPSGIEELEPVHLSSMPNQIWRASTKCWRPTPQSTRAGSPSTPIRPAKNGSALRSASWTA